MSAGPSSESGTITLWMLGLCVALLFLGGVSLDLWRAASERRSVTGIVDAAAIAGASGIDEAHLRATGELRLDPGRAQDFAVASLASHSESVIHPSVVVASDGSAITVAGSRDVPFTLLKVLMPGLQPLQVQAQATSSPRSASP
ncbi:MAG TPA: pilus assembly protein TadG-related protein [Egibacteraceae bacterium]|nr:pilus assembly protein TadG-related protein [Egibacteraceae bacterium]